MLYQLDCESDQDKAVAKEYGVRSYPTFIMLNSDNETADRWVGYSKSYFLGTMESALTDLSSIDVKKARYEKEKTLNDAVVLGRYSNAMREYKAAVDYYTVANTMNTDTEKDYTYEIFGNTNRGVSDTGFSFDDVIVAADAVIASENVKFYTKIYTVQATVSRALKAENQEMVEKYINTGLKLVDGSDDDDAKLAYAELMVEHSLHITKDETKAVEYKKMTLPEGWTEEAGGLNGFAWWCFENKVNLVEAETFARKGVELAEPGKNKAMILDTVAEICNSLGKTEESVKVIKMAITENPDSKFYPEQLTRFEEIVATQNK